MRTRVLASFVVAALVAMFASAAPRHKKRAQDSTQIVFFVQRADKRIEHGDKGLEYKMNSLTYTKSGLNYALAELRANRDPNTRVVALIDDRVQFEAIAEVGEMAINAGFSNIHLFVCFHKTAGMSELSLGPVLKFSETPPAEKMNGN